MVVDGEGFVGCVRGLRDALAGLPVVVGLLPSSRAAHGVVARGYDVFGQGAFGDMVALSCTVSPGAGAARAEALDAMRTAVSELPEDDPAAQQLRQLRERQQSR